MAVYLLDTNFLMYLIDNTSDPKKRSEVLNEVANKLQQPENKFSLTPLIRYEVLRGIAWQDTEKLEQIAKLLIPFESFEITQEISDLASNLYRFDKFEADNEHTVRNLEKRKFDIFHFATAHINGFEMLTNDTDMEKISDLHGRMQTS